MKSIYERALGLQRFASLHPMVQRRFGFSSGDQVASIGRGVMSRVWLGRFYTVPFLYVGTWRNIMFPEAGENIPFTIENYAYCDSFGRETVTWVRSFDFGGRRRRFDATMVYSEQRGKVVDYLGTHQHLAVDIDLEVAANGGLRLFAGAQRFYEGRLAFRFPMFFSGHADVCEWYDDASAKFQIEVNVVNPIWGPLFGYRGSFDVEFRPVCAQDIPPHVKPRREERRE
jgi:hypothetical protein